MMSNQDAKPESFAFHQNLQSYTTIVKAIHILMRY